MCPECSIRVSLRWIKYISSSVFVLWGVNLMNNVSPIWLSIAKRLVITDQDVPSLVNSVHLSSAHCFPRSSDVLAQWYDLRLDQASLVQWVVFTDRCVPKLVSSVQLSVVLVSRSVCTIGRHLEPDYRLVPEAFRSASTIGRLRELSLHVHQVSLAKCSSIGCP